MKHTWVMHWLEKYAESHLVERCLTCPMLRLTKVNADGSLGEVSIHRGA